MDLVLDPVRLCESDVCKCCTACGYFQRILSDTENLYRIKLICFHSVMCFHSILIICTKLYGFMFLILFINDHLFAHKIIIIIKMIIKIIVNKPRIVPWRTERIPQRIQRHSEITLHRSTHPKWEQDKTEKSSYGLDWLQKGIWYAPIKLDTTLFQNVQNITWSHKLHRTDHENLESGADSRRKKHSWNKDPKRHFPRRCTITLTIHNSHDATEQHSQKIRSRTHT